MFSFFLPQNLERNTTLQKNTGCISFLALYPDECSLVLNSDFTVLDDFLIDFNFIS